jgi:hypothetical protein
MSNKSAAVGDALVNGKRVRRVFFTLNNPKEKLSWEALEEKGASTLVYQLEKGDEEETHHYQGVICFTGQKRLKNLKALPGLEKAHFEAVRSLNHAVAYCTKEDTRVDGPWEYGDMPQQGKRNDLLTVKADLDAGMTMSDIAENHFAAFIRHQRAFVSYRRLKTPPRNEKTVVILFVGPSGIGKSRTAHTLAHMLSPGSVFKVPQPKSSGLWFGDYDGQETMIIDEFDGSTCTPTFFNELTDRYPFTLPVIGSAGHQMTAKYILITSNYLPAYWWKKRNAGQVKQTMRRIDVVWPMLHTGVRGFYCTMNGEPSYVPDQYPFADESQFLPYKRQRAGSQPAPLDAVDDLPVEGDEIDWGLPGIELSQDEDDFFGL